MDLAELRINRTAVPQNNKCNGCVHYDGNAQAKGGVCEVGSMPQVCGTGGEKKFGYAPLDELGPDEIDDLATPQLSGTRGAMNEHGDIEKPIAMKRVVLGDEDLSIAQRIHGERTGVKKSLGDFQGEVNARAGVEMGYLIDGRVDQSMYGVAKSLHEMHFAPRKQKKYTVGDVLQFLLEKGMPVTDEDIEKAIKAGAGSRGGRVIGHTKSGKPVYAASTEHTSALAHYRDMMTSGSPKVESEARKRYQSHLSRHMKKHEGFTQKDHEDAATLHRTDHTHGTRERQAANRIAAQHETLAKDPLSSAHGGYKGDGVDDDVKKSLTPNVRKA